MYLRTMLETLKTLLVPSWKVLLAYAFGSLILNTLSHPQNILPLALTPWTPAPGLTLAVLMLFGLRYWPWLVAVTFLVDLPTHGLPPDWTSALMLAASLALSYGAMAVWLTRVLGIDPRFRNLRDLSWFLVAAIIGALLDAIVHVLTSVAGTAADSGDLLADLVNFWVGDLIRLLVVTPLVLVHAGSDWRGWKPTREMYIQAMAIAIALWVIFGLRYTDEFKFFYLLFLPLIWIAMRHGIHGTVVALAATHLGLNAILEWQGMHVIAVVEFQMLMLGLALTGLFLGMTVSVRRATEERLHRREAELNQAMRLAAAGEMAQAIAHELNQPLSALANYARAGRVMSGDPGRHASLLADTLEKIDREATRAGQVVHRLREFFRGGGLRLEDMSIAELIEEGLSPTRRRAERNAIAVQVDLPADLPRVRADRVQIGTVLHNLFTNAIEAIDTSQPASREIVISARRQDRDRIRVCVRDSGDGVATDMRERLFDSFATSKPEGMGLGLAISRTLVEAHGGELWLDSARPARFCFTLPLRP